MNPETLPAIWTLVHVIEAESQSRAARELGVTPSAVSKQLTRLEGRLGVRLLTRTTRRTRPTEEGMALYKRCRPLFDAFADAEEAVRSMRASLSGSVHITATPAFGRALLAPAVGEFAAMHPDLSFELTLTTRRTDLVEEGIDLAVREGPLPDSNLIATKLTSVRVLLCASSEYLGGRPAPTDVHELAQHDILSVPASGPVPGARRIELPGGRHRRLRPRIVINDLLALRRLALDGRGIAPLPSYLVERDLREERLVAFLPEMFEPVQVTALHPDRLYQPTRVKALLAFLVDRFRRRTSEGGRGVALGA